MALPQYKLLIVDDLADNRDLFRRQFERSGFLVEDAANGRAALDLLKEGRFNLVLLDINMPDLDGVEVLRQIRVEHKPSTLPVIMLTASNQIADVVRARREGANDYLMKPLHMPTALARVKAILNCAGKVQAA